MSEIDELRFKIIVEMLTEFPELRERVQKWIQGKGYTKQTRTGK